MKFTIISISLFFISAAIFAQNLTLPLWNESIPNYNNNEIEEKIDTSDIVVIRKVNMPSIEVFKPSLKNNNGMAVIVVPGGGYNVIVYDWEGTEIAKWLNANGITAIVLKYRLPHTKNNIDGRLSPFLDLQRAVRLTRNYSKDWGIDETKVGVIGFSAGGHLAATLGTHFEESNLFNIDSIDTIDCRPDFMILMYPVITFKEPYLHKGSKHFLIGDNHDLSLTDYYSNELHVNKNTPPTFIVHAVDDKSVPVENSIMFFNELKNHSVSTEMHIYPIGGHGFSLAIENEALNSWTNLCLSWLKNL